MIEINDKMLIEIGKKILGTNASTVDENVVKAAGLIGMMSYYYNNVKGLDCNNFLYEWDKKGINGRIVTVKLINENNDVVDSIEINRNDICNPNEWLKKI